MTIKEQMANLEALKAEQSTQEKTSQAICETLDGLKLEEGEKGTKGLKAFQRAYALKVNKALERCKAEIIKAVES